MVQRASRSTQRSQAGDDAPPAASVPKDPQPTASPEELLAHALTRLAPRLDPEASGVAALRRLSGGASQETWAFRLEGPERRMILRRAPEGLRPGGSGIGLAAEAALIRRATDAGVPVPPIVSELRPEDDAGEGFVMPFVEGETLPQRILRQPDFALARAAFAGEAGRALAAIHRLDPHGIALPRLSPQEALDELVRRREAAGRPRPVFELAIRRLAETVPAPVAPRLVHGDFRMGNLMFGPEGLRAVLDWELAHVGDPASDLGWLCMRSWRFGGALPVGGVGRREDLLAAYEAAGGEAIPMAALRWWEMLSALGWGVIVEEMGRWVETGADRSIERHVIARRASEVELVLMMDLTGRDD